MAMGPRREGCYITDETKKKLLDHANELSKFGVKIEQYEVVQKNADALTAIALAIELIEALRPGTLRELVSYLRNTLLLPEGEILRLRLDEPEEILSYCRMDKADGLKAIPRRQHRASDHAIKKTMKRKPKLKSNKRPERVRQTVRPEQRTPAMEATAQGRVIVARADFVVGLKEKFLQMRRAGKTEDDARIVLMSMIAWTLTGHDLEIAPTQQEARGLALFMRDHIAEVNALADRCSENLVKHDIGDTVN